MLTRTGKSNGWSRMLKQLLGSLPFYGVIDSHDLIENLFLLRERETALYLSWCEVINIHKNTGDIK